MKNINFRFLYREKGIAMRNLHDDGIPRCTWLDRNRSRRNGDVIIPLKQIRQKNSRRHRHRLRSSTLLVRNTRAARPALRPVRPEQILQQLITSIPLAKPVKYKRLGIFKHSWILHHDRLITAQKLPFLYPVNLIVRTQVEIFPGPRELRRDGRAQTQSLVNERSISFTVSKPSVFFPLESFSRTSFRSSSCAFFCAPRLDKRVGRKIEKPPKALKPKIKSRLWTASSSVRPNSVWARETVSRASDLTKPDSLVGEGVEEDFFEWLQDVDADCGEELEGEPLVEHYVAGFLDFRDRSGVGVEEASGEEGEEELLERDEVAESADGT
ncbi:glutamate 5-kinase [Striga asiatica]|uniref:Glutamate 5-kinase n=1 Tax=Striga asiatica TaxID=4170 RepID=A0A5A7QCR5_STRAF|nr:glutamate 5-kinase [Striga asiatica]